MKIRWLLPGLAAAVLVLCTHGPEAAYGETAGKYHWNQGDVVERKLGDQTYRFLCIDQNYSDRMENHRPSALFLCTQVIPADLGSVYRYEELADGRFDYVFYPGPLTGFGDGSDYKYSGVRKWLSAWEDSFPGALDIHTGADFAYEGSTGKKTYSQLDAGDLKGWYIGSQKMTDKLFCLSVDEALKYRDYLWKFEESAKENPDSQYGPYCKGYWLRTPAGGRIGGLEKEDTGLVYIVDFVNGSIRPQAVKPDSGHMGTTGVRPAFAMPQDS